MNLTKSDDKALIELAKKGDLSAFDELVRRYERMVYNTAYRLTNASDDASDIAQDAFIRAFNNLKSFRGDSAFSTWMHRIVTNAFLDDRKKKRARPTRSLDDMIDLDEDSVAIQFEDHSPGPAALAEEDERRKLLAHAIQTLPENQRTLIVLFHLQGLAYEEIVEITELPMGTVKSRLNRARLALRERLGPIAELFNVGSRPA
jgi:RNA polymerase sigma-70 factor, ECF subfamily